jgi:hypothetical protein
MNRHLTRCASMILLALVTAGCTTQPWLTEGLDGQETFYAEPTRTAASSREVRPALGTTPPAPHMTETTPSAYRPTTSRPASEFGWDAPAQDRQWRYIVIHHSATGSGSAAQFDRAHRDRGWDGLGYHFVIDNGNGGPDGRVEVGPRWTEQMHGAHTGGTPENEYNELGIGVCLVGDFRGSMPSSRQLAGMRRLVAYLCWRYNIPPENVITHQDAPGANTECPGELLHAYVHGQFKRQLQPELVAICPAWRRSAAR